jgi:beta-glucanase (GH16 family)
MPSFVSPLRTAAAIAILAVGANVGIATASTWTHVAAKKHEAHHVRPTRKARHHVKRKTHAKKPVAHATSLNPALPGIPGNWNLVLDSEFNGSSLNTSIWRAGWFNTGVTSPVNGHEGDCYNSNNVTFPGDGSMHLNVTAQPSTCSGTTYPYTGALVSSNPKDGRASGGFQYTYGVVEARVYIPADGTQIANWPAVWTDGQSWPTNGEDDLMEGLGGTACFHFHDPLGGPGGCDATLTPGWHTFASDWQPGSVTYYYDGTKVGSITTGITTAPMYIILDNTISVDHGSTSKPGSMDVQYVKVWQD